MSEFPNVFRQVREASGAAGFAEVSVGDSTCAAATSSIAPACFLTARKDDLVLEITVYRPGTDVDGLGISVRDHAKGLPGSLKGLVLGQTLIFPQQTGRPRHSLHLGNIYRAAT